MKANRKFKEEEAVSAVIGVILMVAITVAIAATVYVYVSGMMTPTSTGKTMSAIQSTNSKRVVTYKVTAADGGILWSGVTASALNATGASSIPTLGGYGTDTEITVGHTYTLTYAVNGTYTADLLYNGHIIWTSSAATVHSP